MNIHLCQNYESKTEVLSIASTEDCLISPQSSNPVIGAVQDSLVISYKLTKEYRPIEEPVFIQLCLASGLDIKEYSNRIEEIKRHLKDRVFSGYGLISMLLPNDFNFTKTITSSAGEFHVLIKYGVVFSGPLDKGCVGARSNSVVSLLAKEYSNKLCLSFISRLTRITCAWSAVYGFSVGFDDCIPKLNKEIGDLINKAFIKSETAETEFEVAMNLNSAKNSCQKLAAKAFDPKNGFLDIVYSGAKGSVDNLTQITGLLGQQNLGGRRMIPKLSGGRRTLPCYPIESKDKGSIKSKYESRGFISNSFYKGLNSREFFFHAISGREGIVSTSIQTSKAGYAERRIIKRTESAVVKYDGTVRNDIGNIIQYNYGEDPTKLTRVDGTFQSANIYRLADRLNAQVELAHQLVE